MLAGRDTAPWSLLREAVAACCASTAKSVVGRSVGDHEISWSLTALSTRADTMLIIERDIEGDSESAVVGGWRLVRGIAMAFAGATSSVGSSVGWSSNSDSSSGSGWL